MVCARLFFLGYIESFRLEYLLFGLIGPELVEIQLGAVGWRAGVDLALSMMLQSALSSLFVSTIRQTP
ncbi:hypothetical protein DSUL_30107 [Desulfovibrionales bacterium]